MSEEKDSVATSDNVVDPAIDQERKMSEMINRTVNGRFRDFEERFLAKLVKAQAPQPQPAQTPDPNAEQRKADQEQERLTLKALHQQIEAERRARIEAENQAKQTKIRAELTENFSRHMGAKNPHLRPYLNEYLTRCETRDGQVVGKLVDEYGAETFLPVSEFTDQLFTKELNHLRPARNGGLPPNQISGLNGSRYIADSPQQARTTDEFWALANADILAKSGREEVARSILNSFQVKKT